MTVEPERDARAVACPDCGMQVRPGTERLCPRCGYPLLFLRTGPRPEGRVVARIPGEVDDSTGLLPPVVVGTPEPAPVPPGYVRCPRCAHPNPPSRIRCEFCGEDLRMPRRTATVVRAPRRQRRLLRAGLAFVAVAGLAGGAAVVIARASEPAPRTAVPGVSATPSVPGPALVPVDRTLVTASASSAIAGQRFTPANTLDGDRTTAWHSNGRVASTSIGITLTFTFARPVRLARVTIVSGYARSTVDYTNNQRISRATVRTDAGARQWTLNDTSDPQSLDLDGAPTKTVTFVVEAVYPGTTYKDVTVSEVTFSELRA